MRFDSPEALEEYLDSERIRFYKVAVVDGDGILRGKYIDRAKFSSALRNGFGFCDVVLGWDSQDELYDNGTVSSWKTGYRDAQVHLDLNAVRLLPSEEDTAFVLGSFEGEYADACSRSLLRRIEKRANALGFSVGAALEYEFFVFDETPHSIREKNYRGLTPFTPGRFGYSMLRNSVHSELYRDLLDEMRLLEAPIEGLHTETGPGVLEAALCYSSALEAGDRAVIFKNFTKAFLQKRGLLGTFMAKWSNEYPGQSGHLHLSLVDEAGRNVFHSEGGDGLSDTFRHFVAGQVALLPELLAMVCSTTNSYRRLVPGMWAPTHAAWGIENRTTAIRAIPAGSQGARSEYRIGPADGNPYLVMAAALASGLYGIKHKLVCAPTEGNAYENIAPNTVRLSGTLGEAASAFRTSKVARELFGDRFVDYYAATRDFEDRKQRRTVSDYDLARYFEII
jgi:glutamine synthetase